MQNLASTSKHSHESVMNRLTGDSRLAYLTDDRMGNFN